MHASAEIPLPYVVDDPAGDQSDIAGAGRCSTAADADGDNGCDLLGFRAGNDDATIVMEFLIAATSWATTETFVEYRALITGPGGTEYAVRMGLDGAGKMADHAFPYEERSAPGGVQWTVDHNEGVLRAEIPMRSVMHAEPGSDIQIDAIYTLSAPKTRTAAWVYDKEDEIDVVHPFRLAGSTPGAVTHGVRLQAHNFTVHIARPSSDDYVLSLDSALHHASAVFEVNGSGSVRVVIVDGSGIEQANRSVVTEEMPLGEVAPGPWRVYLDFETFNGTFRFALLDAAPAVSGDPALNETVDEPDASPTDVVASEDGQSVWLRVVVPVLGLLLTLVAMVTVARYLRR